MPCMLTDLIVYKLPAPIYVKKIIFLLLTLSLCVCVICLAFPFCNDHQIFGVSRCGDS